MYIQWSPLRAITPSLRSHQWTLAVANDFLWERQPFPLCFAPLTPLIPLTGHCLLWRDQPRSPPLYLHKKE